jgi:hypothetical protein
MMMTTMTMTMMMISMRTECFLQLQMMMAMVMPMITQTGRTTDSRCAVWILMSDVVVVAAVAAADEAVAWCRPARQVGLSDPAERPEIHEHDANCCAVDREGPQPSLLYYSHPQDDVHDFRLMVTIRVLACCQVLVTMMMKMKMP